MLVAVLVGIAALGVVSAVLHYQEVRALRDRGVTTEAVVTEVVREFRDSYVVMEFVAADGRRVSARASYDWSKSPRPRVGDRRVVSYDPQDPEHRVVNGREVPEPIDKWFVGLTVGLVAIAVLVLCGRLDWLIRPLREQAGPR